MQGTNEQTAQRRTAGRIKAIAAAITAEAVRRWFRASCLFVPSSEPEISWEPADYGLDPAAVEERFFRPFWSSMAAATNWFPAAWAGGSMSYVAGQGCWRSSKRDFTKDKELAHAFRIAAAVERIVVDLVSAQRDLLPAA